MVESENIPLVLMLERGYNYRHCVIISEIPYKGTPHYKRHFPYPN